MNKLPARSLKMLTRSRRPSRRQGSFLHAATTGVIIGSGFERCHCRNKLRLKLGLRQAWLIKGIVYDSEIWQKLTEKDISDINKIYIILLRIIVEVHCKATIFRNKLSYSVTDTFFKKNDLSPNNSPKNRR